MQINNTKFTRPSSESFAALDVNVDDDLDEGAAATMSWKSQPTAWNDDVRMNALFAAFRNRDLNPLFYDNKLHFWKETIYAYCLEKELLQVDLPLLEACLSRHGKKPKCLDVVLAEMLKDKTFLTRGDALQPKPGLVKSMFNKMIWSPLAWSAGFLLRQSATDSVASSPVKQSQSVVTSPVRARVDNRPESALVLVSLLESKSQRLLKHLQDRVTYRNVDAVLEYEELCDIYLNNISGESSNTRSDFELVLKYLEVNRKCLINTTEIENKTLVKFALNVNGCVSALTPVESSYQSLKHTERKLEEEIGKFSRQIEETNEATKSQLRQNNKNAALKLLKKRKQLEKSVI